jgi:hypothetical protein
MTENPGLTSRLPLLLADPSPCLRWLVLRDLLDRPEDDLEVIELAALRDRDPLVADLFRMQAPDGSWKADGVIWQGGALRATSLALMRLGYLGFGRRGVGEHPAVRRGAAYLFSRQAEDGSWPMPGGGGEHEGYSMVPLQTAIPLRSLAACGYAADERAERAYQWLLDQRLSDGAWPTGIAGAGARGKPCLRGGVYGYVAGYRRLAHSRWGCRSNTTGSLLCLALHAGRRTGPEARRALDLLLGRETRERQPLGFEVARLVGAEPVRGFFTFFARFDLALVLDLCWRVGATLEDERVEELVQFVWELQGPYGLWDYVSRPQASRWLTFDLLRSLSRLDEAGDWLSAEPRTPFQAYGARERRF